MEFIKTDIEGLILVKPTVFDDDRGYFYESYNEKIYKAGGITCDFLQDNQSYSTYGTIRGFHIQRGEHAQAKLVRVVKGRVLDVAVDVRKDSPTFGKWFSVLLTDENHKQLFIPRGFAHGFSVLSKDAIFQYKVDNYYDDKSEAGFQYNDPELGIDWLTPENKISISAKDKKLPSFKDFKDSL